MPNSLRRWYGLALTLALALSVALVVTPSRASTLHSNPSGNWVIAFNQENGLPANVDQLVANAGGTITTRLPEIGGVAATSSNPNFAAAIAANASVKAVDASTEMSLIDPIADSADNNGGNASAPGPDPQPMPDPLGNQQWDKMRMNATLTGSYAVQQGRRDVVVAVLDTGADQNHIDIAANLDVSRSRSFVPTEPTIQDFNGHGTWCLGAVAAPINGVGVSGVAPNVTLVALKVLAGSGSGQFVWLDQALIYAGLNHFDVASMSLGGYMSKQGNQNHPDYILLNRAIQFARSNGVLPVAAMGNENYDLADGSFFRSFVEAPGEMPGVVSVAATGYYNQKAFYSSYGMGAVDVSAPGGSTRDYTGVPGSGAPPPPYAGLGRLIGPWSSTGASAPSDPFQVCTGPGGTPPCYLYGYVQGTSMATPNTAGVAALIISQFGDFRNNPNKPHMSPTQVESQLQATANNQPCPEPRTVITGAGNPGGPTATCQGNTGYNGFFGKGIVDALRAVTN